MKAKILKLIKKNIELLDNVELDNPEIDWFAINDDDADDNEDAFEDEAYAGGYYDAAMELAGEIIDDEDLDYDEYHLDLTEAIYDIIKYGKPFSVKSTPKMESKQMAKEAKKMPKKFYPDIKGLFNLLWFMTFDARENFGDTQNLYQIMMGKNAPKNNSDKENILEIIDSLSIREIFEGLNDTFEDYDIESYLKEVEGIDSWYRMSSSGSKFFESKMESNGKNIKIMEAKQIDYTNLANNLIDFMVTSFGLVETCEILLDLGYTDDQIYSLGFEEETIESAKIKNDKDYLGNMFGDVLGDLEKLSLRKK